MFLCRECYYLSLSHFHFLGDGVHGFLSTTPVGDWDEPQNLFLINEWKIQDTIVKLLTNLLVLINYLLKLEPTSNRPYLNSPYFFLVGTVLISFLINHCHFHSGTRRHLHCYKSKG